MKSVNKIFLDDITPKFVENFTHADFILIDNDVIGSYTRYDEQSDIDFVNEIYDAVYDLSRLEKVFVREISIKLF